MQANEINRAIISGQFSNDELKSFIDAVKFARGQLGRQNARKLQPGVQVQFTDRLGRKVPGSIDSIKIKNAVVSTAQGRYRVPMNMLEIV
jgi:hypothetical protein